MRIAIAGYGIEGEESYKYFSANPNNKVVIVDEKQQFDASLPEGAKTILGAGIFERLQDFDLVIRTAGLAPRKIKTNGKIWSATNEFFSKCPCMIIGVTGSKGKGTTASLIASILTEAGKKVWLVGNIGKPSLEMLNQIKKNDIVVYELSSFQLWDIEKSPHISVVLFIELEHQDVHLGMDEYVNAKANIAKYQTVDDMLIYNETNEYARRIAQLAVSHKIGYPNNNSAHVEEGFFWHGEQKICSISSLKIVGGFNQINACAAIDAVWQITQDTEAIERGISAFKGLPHRLQLVRELDGVSYYDDSIATIPGAAIAALRSFDGLEVIILGGSSKGADFSELALEMTKRNVKAILIGNEADRIASACKIVGFHNYEMIENPTMEYAVRRAHELAKPGGVVLLSPAAASFDMFKNYTDRGEKFASAVMALDSIKNQG